MSDALLASGIMPSSTPSVGKALFVASTLGAVPDLWVLLSPSIACVHGAGSGGPTLVSAVVGCILILVFLMPMGTM